MRRPPFLLLALLLVACSNGDGPPPGVDCPVTGGLTLPPAGPGLFGPPGASVGSVMKGDVHISLNGAAAVYRQGSATAAFTVLDAFTRDANRRPTGELFLFLRTTGSTSVEIVPVTLAQLKDENFVPTGAFAVYADSYDETAGDYTRWLLGTSGCIRSTNTGDAVLAPRVEAFAHVTGEWQSHTGAPLGAGSASVLIFAPVIDYRSQYYSDLMMGSVKGVRAKFFQASTFDAFQVLHPAQTRLVIVGTEPADSTREIWFSLAGIPQPNDSIPLGTPTLEEARAGRTVANGSFGMMRVLQLDNVGQSIVREIWRSTGGYVKLDQVVQNGPLALCGDIGAEFEMTMQGVSLANPGVNLGTSTADGVLGGRLTILPQSDTLRVPAILPSLGRKLRLAAPTSPSGLRCP